MLKGQAERLFPLLQELLAEAGAGFADLTALAVGTGPGNFTGVRIAVSAARGLALARGIPAHGVSLFAALAHGQPRPCLAAIDARQGRVYLQDFGTADGAPQLLGLADVGSAALTAPGAALTVTGDHAPAIAAALGARAAAPLQPVAVAMALIAARRPGPAPRPAPLYLRPADAAPPREAPPVILP